MPNTIISEGKTTNEAVEKGLKILGVSKEKAELKIKENYQNDIEKEVKKEVKILTAEELNNAENNAKIFLSEFLPKIGNQISYQIKKTDMGLEISINGPEASTLIGYRGDTLYDFQNILSVISNKGITSKVRVILDIENYKEKRIKILENLALKLARTVEKTGKPVTLEPMQAYERKIIHSKLQDFEKITTKSIGEEPRRRIVISLKK